MKIYIYKYILYSDEKRDSESLHDYAKIITDIYSERAPHTTVIVKSHYFLVIGELSRSNILKIGRAFGKVDDDDFKKLFISVRGTSRLFKRAETLTLTKSEYSNIYHIFEKEHCDEG